METLHRIELLLKENQMTDSEFCEKLGLYPSALSEWRKGKTQSFKKHIDKIANMFDVPTDYLLGLSDDPSPRTNKNTPATDRQIKFALFGDADITDELLEDVKRFADLQLQIRKERGQL